MLLMLIYAFELDQMITFWMILKNKNCLINAGEMIKLCIYKYPLIDKIHVADAE